MSILLLSLQIITLMTVKVLSQNEFLLSESADCTCINSYITYECIAVGPGATIWKGSAFNCPESSNEIQLFHSDFQDKSALPRETCNNGEIVGYAVNVSEDLHFRSSLTVQVTSVAMNGSTVECEYDDGADVQPLHSSIIVLTRESLHPPVNIHLSNVSISQLEFTWDPVPARCLYVRYRIESVNCGRCPTTTSLTTVTCTDVQIISNKQVCTFGVSTVVCSNIVGTINSILVQLKALDISVSRVDVTPTYDNDTRHLIKLNTNFKEVISYDIKKTTESTSFIMGNISRAAVSYYTVNYTDSNTGKSCGGATILATSCTTGSCSHEFEISSSACPRGVNFNVTIFGTNAFGNGKVSSPIKRDYMNTFVEVKWIPGKNSVICSFFSESNSTKSCQITYCDQNYQYVVKNKNATGNDVSLSLDNLQLNNGRYYFMSTASNTTLTVNIAGYHEVKDMNHSAATIIITSLFGVIVLLLALNVIALVHIVRLK